jgi:hypothetical protein
MQRRMKIKKVTAQYKKQREDYDRSLTFKRHISIGFLQDKVFLMPGNWDAGSSNSPVTGF